jgi:hypothetical protein
MHPDRLKLTPVQAIGVYNYSLANHPFLLPSCSLVHMSQSNDLPQRVDRLERDALEIRLTASALLATVEQHQENFEILAENLVELKQMTAELKRLGADHQARMANLEEVQQDIRTMLQILTRRSLGDN